MSKAKKVDVLNSNASCPEVLIVQHGGIARSVVWPGMGAMLRSMHKISLQARGRTKNLCHQVEAVYYVMAGKVEVVDLTDGSKQPLIEGSMVHVEPGTGYRFEAGAGETKILGGPCPADPNLYSHDNL